MNAPSVVIIGATSAIAEQIGRIFAEKKSRLFLVGRNKEKLEKIAQDLEIRGAAQVEYMVVDLSDIMIHKDIVAEAGKCLGDITHLYVAHGTLPDNASCENDPQLAVAEINLNLNSVISIVLYFSAMFKQQANGAIVVISSVAGDRGRQSNYIYGAAKGGLSIFLSGLRNRLFADNVQVVTVKPGFVDSPMTASFAKGPLWATPEKVARLIVRGVNKKRNIIYVPGFWRVIMLIIIHIPEFIFKRLKL